ncbi:hypothetical protein HHK36_004441 [Tetracentron sinense]|uniref:J domain-containing protein n=1 Tax=Tetracentron sinense TaxID=13715 RepID=A0A835DPG8_TETSI|nr:hypothetical protein HHK36_004441 [Tetracentron sinense]
MASTTAPPTLSILHGGRKAGRHISEETQIRRRSHSKVRIFALQEEGGRKKAPPGVDTRIHWDSPDEGWIGGNSSKPAEKLRAEEERQQDLLSGKFADLLDNSTDSHYQFLGVSAEADLEEIKAAYRRLSKEYHPDTTSLPLKVASDKFMKLREVYDVLSNEERRSFYNWTLAQEAVSRQAEKMKMKFEDPYEQEVNNWKPIPDMVDRLGGKNMELSDQALSALTVDAGILIFSICCIVYVVFFKEQY